MQGWLAPLEARVLRDGITYHLQGAESVRQCVTHDAPVQKPTVFLEMKGIYPVQKASIAVNFSINQHTFIHKYSLQTY